MSPGSARKKPVCQKCGHLMAGHKRPMGVPICPRDGSVPASPQPQPPTAPAPLARAYAQASPDFVFNPTPSGYWHRVNPNWTDPEPPANPLDRFPKRQPSAVTTEPDNRSQGAPSRRPPVMPTYEVIDVDAEDEHQQAAYGHGGCTDRAAVGSPEHEYEYEQDYEQDFDPDYTREQSLPGEEEDASDTSSSASSVTILKRMTRRLSQAIGRSTPLASLYSSPYEQVAAITSAAEAEGLYTRVRHVERSGAPVQNLSLKHEPATPTRTLPTREHSWFIAVGRDRGAVDVLADSQVTPPKPTVRLPPESGVVLEPYDYQRGLSRELNERVGAYPDDPTRIRNTFVDVLVAGAVGGLVVFYCLSSL
ncbi:hypothetical protein DICSQDRAFT_161160 [Dichomitus squalens LYAD-421 SS1]|uniref:Uncharacterized protein n=1 Tax=Dichomitus squalens (strain LYAD-421) TaxID=732165 RepID=R7T206_DICSQ|nr:uncharacterized protein DICSQDRAFT_161160 [Dichomitus squalens LYAD-421 SS1]EJF62313.1 hypothetical protein DICSQDRAFT_161160 [Dichomitus squalens LYAD-421 SS1]